MGQTYKQHLFKSWTETGSPPKDCIQTGCLSKSYSIQGPDPKHGLCFVVRELSPSTTTLQLLDRIQKKALRIIGLDSDEACANFNLYHLLSTDVELQLPWSCTKCTQVTAVHTSIGCPHPPTFQKNDSVTLVYLCQPNQLAGSLCCCQNMWNSLSENVVGKINDKGSALQYSHTQTDDISCVGFYPCNLSVSRCEPLIRIIGGHA